MSQLRFYFKDQALFSHKWDSPLLRIGRGGDCDIQFDDPELSRTHLILRRRDGRISIEDSSMNGVLINGQKLAGPNTPLPNGIRCELSKNLSFEIHEKADAPAKTLLKNSKVTLLMDSTEDRDQIVFGEPSLEILLPTGQKISKDITQQGLSIGRHSSNDIVVDDPYVSQFHLQVEIKSNEVYLKDLGSANGLKRKNLSFSSCRLFANEEIEFGQSKLILRIKTKSVSLNEKETSNFFGILSEDKQMRKLFSFVEIASQYTNPIFIHGETGTGKELFARAIHSLSNRSQKEFLSINCAALPKDLVESELFGHERGAFTSASNQRQGAFEIANGGTLFLDEIGELDLQVQAKLLRTLETGEYARVGSHEKRYADLRIVTATHRDLKAMVEEGAFREDLYYRLHVIPLHLPPLRERLSDLDILIPHLLKTLKIDAEWSDEAIEALRLHDFPGNIRELKNIVSRAAIEMQVDLSDPRKPSEKIIRSDHLRFIPGLEKYKPVRSEVEKEERERLVASLKRHQYHQSRVASELGLAVSSLHDKIKRYAISIPKSDKNPIKSSG